MIAFGTLALMVLTGAGLVAGRRIDRFVGNAPVRFYGRVVDESGVGIPGVRVEAELSTVRWMSSPLEPSFKRKRITAITDEEGRFSFHASSGKILRLGPFEKAGWEPSVAGFRRVELGAQYPPVGYEYPPGARKRPDNPDDPIIYPMVRTSIPASGKE